MENTVHEIKKKCSKGLSITIVSGIADIDRFDNIYGQAGCNIIFMIDGKESYADHLVFFAALNKEGENLNITTISTGGDKSIKGVFTMPDSIVEIIAIDAYEWYINWSKNNNTEKICLYENVLISMSNDIEHGTILVKTNEDEQLFDLKGNTFQTRAGAELELHVVPDQGYALKNSPSLEHLFSISGVPNKRLYSLTTREEIEIYNITVPHMDLCLNPIFGPIKVENEHDIAMAINGYKTKIHDMILTADGMVRHINSVPELVLSLEGFKCKSVVEILLWVEDGYKITFDTLEDVVWTEDSEIGLTPVQVNLNGRDVTSVPYQFSFVMPDHDVNIGLEVVDESKVNDNIEMIWTDIIDYFTIPDELAMELSNLLTKQTIRERLLSQVVNDPVRYEKVEKMLAPITDKIEAIKTKITKEFIPSKYNSPEYIWNYDGYSIDGNKIQILKAKVNIR